MIKKRKRREVKDQNLNITSLMDILTILLIFLVMSFSTEENEITPPDDFDIPLSVSERPARMAIKVSIAENAIRVEDTVIVELKKGVLDKSEVDANKKIKSLLNELKKQKGKMSQQPKTEGGDQDEDESEIVYLEAARGTQFQLLQQVLQTSAAAGFHKFRLAVQKAI